MASEPVGRPRRSAGVGRSLPQLLVLVIGLVLGLAISSPAVRAAQPEPPTTAPGGEAQHVGADDHAADEHAEEEHEGGLMEVVARVINFGILAGLVGYFLRPPIAAYLADRREQVRGALVTAARTRKEATDQLGEIDRRLAALPAELETLRTRGAEEIAAEEQRIAAAAEAERARLLEQTRRELDLEVRVAKEQLRVHAADLATGIARSRIGERITEADHGRLLDRYLQQLDRGPRPGGEART